MAHCWVAAFDSEWWCSLPLSPSRLPPAARMFSLGSPLYSLLPADGPTGGVRRESRQGRLARLMTGGQHSLRTPLVPEETKGVELSDAIPRMLPSEAAMLGHPVLKCLWHARRAELALLTYRVEGVEIERSWTDRLDVAERRVPVGIGGRSWLWWTHLARCTGRPRRLRKRWFWKRWERPTRSGAAATLTRSAARNRPRSKNWICHMKASVDFSTSSACLSTAEPTPER